MAMANENLSKFYFIAHFVNREFIRQKALNEDNEQEIGGESVEQVLDLLWSLSLQYIKRKVVVDGDNFMWAENENPSRVEIDKFLVLQDQGNKKTFATTQVSVDKMRGKQVNEFVYTYGKKICNKRHYTPNFLLNCSSLSNVIEPMLIIRSH